MNNFFSLIKKAVLNYQRIPCQLCRRTYANKKTFLQHMIIYHDGDQDEGDTDDESQNEENMNVSNASRNRISEDESKVSFLKKIFFFRFY